MNAKRDEQLDPLLAEALGRDEPRGDLIDRICALTDGDLHQALDRAIGPHTVACDQDELVRRILAATSDRPAVLARIGRWPSTAAWRIAATIALGIGMVTVLAVLAPPSATDDNRMAGVDHGPLVAPASSEDTALELELEAFALGSDSAFDQRIAQVSAGVAQIRTDAIWADSPDALVERAGASVNWYPTEAGLPSSWF